MPATIDATIAQIINNAVTQADTYLGKSDSATQAAITSAMGFASPGDPLTAFAPAAIEPGIPPVADMKLSYEAQLSQLVTLLSNQLAGYYATYYPLVNDAYDEATAWLVHTITVGGTGIAPSVEAQMWQRGRTRILNDGARAQNALITDFSSRGFTIPPGALAGKLQEIEFEKLAKNSELSGNIAIEAAKIEIENIKFAVDLALKTRIAAMNAANDYIRAIVSTPDSAIKFASLGGEAQARMMSATADLYRARLQRDDLILNSANADQQTKLANAKLSIDAFYSSVGNQVTAAVAGAKAYGDSAVAALNQLQTVASSSQSLF